MLSITIGPLALPVSPLLLMASVWLAASLARRLASPDAQQRAENAVWLASALGLLAARVGHVLLHGSAYLASPWDMLDLRDGGWLAWAGLPAGLLGLWWRARLWPTLRQPLARAALAGLALWVAGSAVLTWFGGGAARSQAPEVLLIDVRSGQQRSLAQLLAGKPAVVNLWASWCGPCRAEMPVLAAAQQQNPDIQFIFVNQGESGQAVLTYLQRSNVTLHNVWLDSSSALGPASGSSGLPTTLFFAAHGRRVSAHFGMLNAASLQAQLQSLRAPD